jgi:deazaflavin-dependent oxidoreductase (nitroreductase family)
VSGSGPRRPGPLLGPLLRAPAFLYSIGAGRLLGHRFLLLTHRGRRSGRSYRTVLEVIEWEPAAGEAVVMSGFGPRSNWYLNALAGGAQEVRIGRLAFAPETRQIEAGEASALLAAYERRNRLLAPIVRSVLSRLADLDYDGSDAARRELLARLPLLGLRQAAPSASPGSGADRSATSDSPR